MKYSANSVWENKDEYDVAVIGAGHAGIEAALASARLGASTVIFTINMDWVGNLPCNPSIGGPAKEDGFRVEMETYFKGKQYGKSRQLWEGEMYMKSDQTITLSETVSEQPNGIVLCFSLYDPSTNTTTDANFNYVFVPKYHIENFNTRGVECLLVSGDHIVRKYLFVRDKTITGVDANASTAYMLHGVATNNATQVLRRVIGV